MGLNTSSTVMETCPSKFFVFFQFNQDFSSDIPTILGLVMFGISFSPRLLVGYMQR